MGLSRVTLSLALCTVLSLFLINGLVGAEAKDAGLGAKVVAFCEEHKGEQIGNGECATLAAQALKAAGAKRRGKDDPNGGDYTWGELVYTLTSDATGPKGEGKRTEIRAGDIIQ